MTDIAPLPEWIAAIFANEEREARTAPVDVELDLPYSIVEAERWLTKQPQAADGNASDTFFRYAARLKDLALSEPVIIDLLHRYNPSYDEDDIGQRVANAFAYGQNGVGSDRPKPPEEVFAGVEIPEPPPALVDVGFRTMAFLRAQTYPPIEWRWHRRIPSCKPIIVTGPPKTGKTTFLLNLAVHLAGGIDFLGAATRPSDVVMLLAEDEYGQARDNLLAIREAVGCDPAVLDRIYLRSVLSEPVEGGHWLCHADDNGKATNTPFMEQIVAPFLASLHEPVWMVDPLVEFVRFNRYSEQAPRGLVHWLNNVAKLGSGVTPLITDHPTIASVEQGRDIGGSVQMEGSFPTVAALKAGKWQGGITKQRPMSFALKYSRYAPEHTVDFYRLEGSPAFSTTAAPGNRPEDHRIAVYRHVLARLAYDPPAFVTKTNVDGGYGPKGLAHDLAIEESKVKTALEECLMLRWLEYHPGGGGGRQGHAFAHYARGAEGPKLSKLAPIEEENPEGW